MRKINRPLLGSVALLALLLGGFASQDASQPATRFYVVRHAERFAEWPVQPGPGAEPHPLNRVGMRRAMELRTVLRDVPIAAVYSTDNRRTWQTATPVAIAAGVEITPYGGPGSPDLAAWAVTMRDRHRGESVLIVGHSNTVPTIVRTLSGVDGDFGVGADHDNLFVVTITGGAAETSTVERRRYPVVEHLADVELLGDIAGENDLSAVAMSADHSQLIIASDEGSAVQVFVGAGDRYTALATIELSDDGEEIDIEGITPHGGGNVYYAVGSHSWRRRNIFRPQDTTSSYADIKDRFELDSPDREAGREHLIRFEVDPATGQLAAPVDDDDDLAGIFAEDQVLKTFSGIPSKENGIDIEGIASDGEHLYLGFRGPVLRHGLVPVVVLSPGTDAALELRYVMLDGHGIRDITAVEGGFLIVAGPVGDGVPEQWLYFWDGNDCLPGVRGSNDPPRGEVVYLGSIPSPAASAGAKAEAIVVLEDPAAPGAPDGGFYEFYIVYDSAPRGRLTRFRAPHPDRLRGSISPG